MNRSLYLSFVKAFSWRFVSIVFTFTLVFLVSGNVDLSIRITFLEFFLKTGLYFLHDRLWLRIK